jgi:hypothetical protein
MNIQSSPPPAPSAQTNWGSGTTNETWPHGPNGFDSIVHDHEATFNVHNDPDLTITSQVNQAVTENDNVKFPDHSSDDEFESDHP